MKLAGGAGESLPDLLATDTAVSTESSTEPVPESTSAPAAAAEGEYMAPWIDTEDCTACDECTNLNSGIFEYNDSKKATIKDPRGGPYKDLVKAAEKCTALVIHPGLPLGRNEKGIDKWIKRGSKFN
jgi:pyruvate-ferredoxin/flavodoxin oxidoreductase